LPESVGAYLTFEPAQGRTDAQRNCVSNIHGRGLTIDDAARRIVGLAVRASLLGITGVGLHDDDPTVSLDPSPDVSAPTALSSAPFVLVTCNIAAWFAGSLRLLPRFVFALIASAFANRGFGRFRSGFPMCGHLSS
jgi:hypothetical protein